MQKYIITKGENSFDATEEQGLFFDFIEHGSGNAVIKASAGSAKTSTIENCLKYIPENKKVLFIAFNVSVRDEIQKDVTRDRTITKITTFHGLGYTFVLSNLDQKPEVYEYKYKKYINDNIDQITSFKETKSLGAMRSQYIRNISRLVEYARYYCVMKPKDIVNLTKIYSDIVLIRDEAEVASEVLKWGQNETSVIDYTDMIWLPYVLNMESRTIKFDYVFVDEAQDVTVAEEKLVEKVKGRGCRLVAVGDENQRINVWCGASKTAMDNFKNAPNTKLFKLSTSFRIPKIGETIVHENFPDIEIHSANNAIEGQIKYDVSLSFIGERSMVLCRNLAPLLKAMLTVMRMNKACYLKGWETELELFQNLVKEYKCKFIDRKLISSDGLMPQLYKTLFQKIDLLVDNHGLTYEEAIVNDGVLDLYDKIMSIDTLSEGLSTTEELLEKLNIIFSKENDTKDAIIFSTVHKAKGLEADNVFILRPSLMPNPYAHAEWEIEAERNLKYVAYTRFKKTLNFLHEEKWEIYNGDTKTNLKKDFEEIKELIGYEKGEISPLKNCFNTKNIKVVKEEKKINYKVKGGLKFGNLLK